MSISNNFRIAVIAALLSVLLGAFGAHALKTMLDAPALLTWETANRYLFMHAVAMFIVVLFRRQRDLKWLQRAAAFFVVGMVLFSGSVYLLSLRSLLPFSIAFIGPITPLGGVSFMCGWLCCLFATPQLFSQSYS